MLMGNYDSYVQWLLLENRQSLFHVVNQHFSNAPNSLKNYGYSSGDANAPGLTQQGNGGSWLKKLHVLLST